MSSQYCNVCEEWKHHDNYIYCTECVEQLKSDSEKLRRILEVIKDRGDPVSRRLLTIIKEE